MNTTSRKRLSTLNLIASAVVFVIVCLLQPALAQAQWTTNGTNINNTNSGNVGIGTTAPAYRLSVVIDDGVNTGVTQILALDHTTSGTPTAGMGTAFTFRAKRSNGDMAPMGYIAGVWEDPTNGTEDGALVFAPVLNSNGHGTERMRINSIGNVGIGTTNPASLLHLRVSSGDVVQRFSNAGGGSGDLDIRYKYESSQHRLGLADSNGVWMFYTQYAVSNTNSIGFFPGKVGIGTASPAKPLDVVGDINASGTITGGNVVAKYQDLAEWVESSQPLAAGTVVILDPSKSNQVVASAQAYDSRVAGVISAKPGITLGEAGEGRVLVASTGRVKVKVDAANGPINIGDLLVTSDKEGIAMKSVPVEIGGVRIHRPGTLIGKALEPLAHGTGEILVLLSLQ